MPQPKTKRKGPRSFRAHFDKLLGAYFAGHGYPREARAIACECGGYCDEDRATPEETKKYGCGRVMACCNRSFICRVCGARWIAKLVAPEYS